MKNWMIILLVIIVVFGLVVMVTQCGKVAEEPGLGTTTTTVATTLTSTTTTTTTTSTTTTTTIPDFSISGTVNFVTTSDGIRGGVAITVTESSSVVDSTTANTSTGTFEVNGFDAGTYTLIASKDGWTIPTIEVIISGADASDQDFTAEPTSWEVLRVGGGESLDSVASCESVAGLEGIMYAAGSGSSVLLTAEATDPTTWTADTSPTPEVLVEVFEGPAGNNMILYSRYAAIYVNTGSGWVHYPGTGSTEGAVAADMGTSTTAETVSETGELWRTEDGLTKTEITPAGAFIRDVRLLDAILDKCVAVGNGGYVGHRYSGSWLTRTSGTTEDLIGVEYWLNKGTMAVSSNGTIFVTTSDKHENFTVDLSGVPYSLNGIRATNVKNTTFPIGALVVGDNGLIMKRK